MILFLSFLLIQTNRKEQILAIQEVIATYEGTRHIPCMFRTALCPDHCDHAKDVAVFKIKEYTKYEKLNKYGDDKTDEFLWDLKVQSDNNKLHPEYLKIVKTLKPGQNVRIHWTHFYITNDGASYPERSVTYFEIIE